MTDTTESRPVRPCGCREGDTPGTVHRADGPCYLGEQPAQPAGPPIMRYFDFLHLREPLRGVSAEFAQLAHYVALELPAGPEQSVALRKLLEAKDAAVRAALDLPRPAAGEQVLGVLRETRVGEVCCGAGPVAAAGEPVFREGAGGGCCRSEQPAEGAGEEGADRG